MTMKWIEQKREYKQYKARIAVLPPSYRTAVAGFERYFNHLGGMSDGESILVMLDDLASLFEQGAAASTPVRDIVGADPVEFIDTFLSNYPAGNWIARERERLTAAIDEAEALESNASGTST